MIESIKDYLQTRSTTDLEVSFRAQKIWEQLPNKQITSSDLYQIQQAHGYDVACGVLFKAFKQTPQCAEFAKSIEKTKEAYDKSHQDVLAVVLVHNPWEAKNQNEDYQWRLKNMAADAGFDTTLPEMQFRRSIFPNAYYYQELLKRWAGRRVIMITHGLASLEMRLVLEKSIQLDVDIIGWLNVSGMVYGTSLAPSNKDMFYNMKKYFNDEHPVLPEVARSNTFCYNPLKIDPKITTVNIVGLRPQRYFYFFEKAQDRNLNYWGPHDGYVTIGDYLNKPGITYPIWGQGHYVQVEIYKRRLQAALRWMVNRSEASF